LTSAANAATEYVPGGAIQLIPSIGTLDLVNIVGAVGSGKGSATSVKDQILAVTLNQFGSNGSEIGVAGPYFVLQGAAFGPGARIDAVNSNSSFTPAGLSTTGGSQIIATTINNIGVDFAPDTSAWLGDPKLFEALQNFGAAPQGGGFTVTQQNSMTAGYDTNGGGAVGTGGAAIIGKATEGSTGTNTSGLQVSSVGINSVSIGVPDRTEVNVKISQNADLTNTNIDLFNVADAGAETGVTPPPPGPPKAIDPEIQNIQQIASFSANTVNLGVTGSDPTVPGFVPGTVSVNLVSAFDKTTNPQAWSQIPNQNFTAGGEINLYNVAQALTWAPGTYNGPNTDWNGVGGDAGKGNVQIGNKDYVDGVSGPVKQIAAFTVNTVSGPTSQNPLELTDGAIVFAGSINDGVDPTNPQPEGLKGFKQVANLAALDIDGRANPATGGAGVLDVSLVLAAEANAASGFPGWAGVNGLPVSPGAPQFWWTGVLPFGGANNTAIAGTGVGNAKIEALDQITAITANSFSFDNAVRNDKQEVQTANTDKVGGLIEQEAILPGGSFATFNTQLANLAVAVTGKGAATLDTVSQTNAVTVNSFTAGTADFKTNVPNPADTSVFLQGGLTQTVTTGGALNLGNVAVALGSGATAKDVKQINAVSLNTASINNVSGGTIGQTLNGPLNVNSGNYLSAVATGLNGVASITGGTQVGVVSVNSITAAPVVK
jgi:hypothetical protein